MVDLIMALPPGQEFYLFSQSSQISWLLEDPDFHAAWRESYMKMLRKETAIILIHSIDRKLESLISAFMEWLPMELTGYLTTYYYPQFEGPFLEPSLLVVKDHAAAFHLSYKNTDKPTYSHYFTDPVTVKQAEYAFQGIIAKSRLIYNKYWFEQSLSLLEKLHAAAE